MPIFRRTDVTAADSRSFSSRWTFALAGSVAQGLVRFLYSVLIGRFVGVAALGTVNSAISVALLLSLLWPTSAGQGATRFVAQMRGAGRDDQAQAVANYLGRRMLLSSFALAAVAFGTCLFILRTDLATAACCAVLLLGYASWSFARGVQYGGGQIARAAMWDVGGSVLAIGLLVLVLLLKWNPVLLLPMAVAYGLYGLVCWPQKSTGEVDPSLVRQMNTYVRYGVLGTLSSTGLLQLSMIAAHFLGSDLEAGFYAAALSLATPATMLARTVSQVLFPSMAEAGGREDPSSLRRQTDLMTRGLVVTMVAVFGALSLASPLVVDLFFGEQYVEAKGLLSILLIAVMFTTLPVACINRLNSTGTHGARFVSLTAMSGLILAVILWFPLSHLLGLKGVALGYLIATLVTATVSIVRCWRLDGQEWSLLFAKAFVAIALVVAGLTLTNIASLPDIAGVGLALGFTAIWGFICRRDVQRIRSARTSPQPAAAAAGPAQPDGRQDEQDGTTANS